MLSSFQDSDKRLKSQKESWAHKDVALMSLEMERGSHEPSDAGDSKIWKRQEIIS